MSCIDCGGTDRTRTGSGAGATAGARGGVPSRSTTLSTSVQDGPTLDGPVTTTATEGAAGCADLGAMWTALLDQDWPTLRAELGRVPWWAWALLAVLLLRRRR